MAAKIVLNNRSRLPTSTTLLSELCWLSIQSRMSFQLACTTYKVLVMGQPGYSHTR